MPIRRKSDAARTATQCTYYQQMAHERDNQAEHESRRHFSEHDPSPCWCCCTDCTDLVWYHPPRKGLWWQRTPSGELRLMQENAAASPGSPETRTS